VEKNQNSGKRLTVDFKDGGKVELSPPAETTVYMDGKLTPVAKLQRGDNLNFYISEDRLAAQLPQEPETTVTQFVVVPIVAQQPVEHETSSMTASLPHTGSDLPMFAIGGVLALMLAGALSLFRALR
jgi:LPXTG-motif cell wall-anchored protein